jgi:hypothetical protein
MKNAVVLLVHLLAGLAILLGTGGTRAVLAENILLKQQLLVLQRSRRRAPNLRPDDRFLFGVFSQFLSPRRLIRTAIILKPVPCTLSSWVQGFQISIPLLLQSEAEARSKRALTGTDPSHL